MHVGGNGVHKYATYCAVAGNVLIMQCVLERLYWLSSRRAFANVGDADLPHHGTIHVDSSRWDPRMVQDNAHVDSETGLPALAVL